MNNAQLNHFSRNPVNLDISRSKFSRPLRKLTTFMSGRVIPLMCEEILPGDSVKMNLATLVRTQTPIFPVMDNSWLDVHFYFVPCRQVWEHWKNFMGERDDDDNPWYQSSNTEYRIPYVSAPTSGGNNLSSPVVTGWACGTIADYFDIPIKKNINVNALPFRAYCLIWNNYYRDQNTMKPVVVPLGDSATTGYNDGVIGSGFSARETNYNTYLTNTYNIRAVGGAAPLPCCKLHDLFTSCLPSPQKGPSVITPIGGIAPVRNGNIVGNYPTDPDTLFSPVWFNPSEAAVSQAIGLGTGSVGNTPGTFTYNGDPGSGDPVEVRLSLVADLSKATAASVNQIREAFMVQRIYEAWARGGSRYFETIRSFFNVTVPDLTVQIPEFLGGRRIPLTVVQVAQTSASTSGVTPQGNVSAYSLTTDRSYIFHKSFTEHGFLIAVGMVRTDHTYSQGIPKLFLKRSFFDFYNPKMANAPEQPVYQCEIFSTPSNSPSSSTSDWDSTYTGTKTVFGYQEAWYEYRYSPSRINGEFRPDYALPLDAWHYGDYYASAPTLSAGWMREPSSLVQRTLAVSGQDQYMGDFLFDAEWVRPMPVYSIPGLLDHH